jgi:hypothetical protein
MKSRIQIAGVEHGSKDLVLWKGELPQISGMPGMRLVLNDSEKDLSDAYSFRQVVLEVDLQSGDLEQVVYVSPVSKAKARELLTEAKEQPRA